MPAPSPQWLDTHQTVNALSPDEHATYKAGDTLADRLQRLGLPGPEDISDVTKIVDALTKSLNLLMCYGPAFRLLADIDSDMTAGPLRSNDGFDSSVFQILHRKCSPSPSSASLVTFRSSSDSVRTQSEALEHDSAAPQIRDELAECRN